MLRCSDAARCQANMLHLNALVKEFVGLWGRHLLTRGAPDKAGCHACTLSCTLSLSHTHTKPLSHTQTTLASLLLRTIRVPRCRALARLQSKRSGHTTIPVRIDAKSPADKPPP